MMQIPSFPLQRGLQLTGHVSATCGSFLKQAAEKLVPSQKARPQRLKAHSKQCRHRRSAAPPKIKRDIEFFRSLLGWVCLPVEPVQMSFRQQTPVVAACFTSCSQSSPVVLQVGSDQFSILRGCAQRGGGAGCHKWVMASFAARILGGAGYAVFPSLLLEKCEGTERRTAHPIQSTPNPRSS